MTANIKGTLKHGLKVGEKLYLEFEMRECTTADLFAAEEDASVDKKLSFRGALIGRQLVKLGEISGPIPFASIGKLHPEDFDLLVKAQDEADKKGKTKPGS